MSKLSSAAKKASTLVMVGLEPYQVGKHNFENPVLCVEIKAAQRAEICKTCPMFVKEPIDFLRVTDERIPALSEMMCDDCGCVLSYKTRQSITICENWKQQD